MIFHVTSRGRARCSDTHTNCQQALCCARLRSWLLKPSKMAFFCHCPTKPSQLGTSMVPKLLIFSLVLLRKRFLLHKVSHHGKLFPPCAVPKLLCLPWEMPRGLREVNVKALEEQVPLISQRAIKWIVQPLSGSSGLTTRLGILHSPSNASESATPRLTAAGRGPAPDTSCLYCHS